MTWSISIINWHLYVNCTEFELFVCGGNILAMEFPNHLPLHTHKWPARQGVALAHEITPALII